MADQPTRGNAPGRGYEKVASQGEEARDFAERREEEGTQQLTAPVTPTPR